MDEVGFWQDRENDLLFGLRKLELVMQKLMLLEVRYLEKQCRRSKYSLQYHYLRILRRRLGRFAIGSAKHELPAPHASMTNFPDASHVPTLPEIQAIWPALHGNVGFKSAKSLL